MDINNNRISERQCFRTCLLENIAIPMLVAPYVTIRYSGAYHTIAFAAGLLLFTLYASIMWKYAKWMPEGMVTHVKQCRLFVRNGISILYILRYVLRCAVIVLYFSKVTNHYMLRSIPQILIAIPFVLVCGYGAVSNLEKRGRLMELLFWWMILPLIFIAVFVVSNANWITINKELLDIAAIRSQKFQLFDIARCAYYVVLLSSGIELMMYTIAGEGKNKAYNVKKIIIWIMFALSFAYVFIFGVLGQEWVAKDNMAALNVMEAAAVPFGIVQRMDYAVLAFWIIGVFAMVSGYMFYAKQYAIISVLRNKNIKESVIVLSMSGLILVVMAGLYNPAFYKALTSYLIYFDLIVSLLVPVLINKKMLQKKTIATIVSMCIIVSCLSGCGKRYESKSVEKRDYVKTMIVKLQDQSKDNASCYLFTFNIMNLEEYSGNGTGKLQTDTFSCDADSVEAAISIYYDEKGQQLDLGHMEEIKLIALMPKPEAYSFAPIIEELSEMPFVPKSIPVYEGESEKMVTLRERIKILFALKQ